jgi:hypothetical protein
VTTPTRSRNSGLGVEGPTDGGRRLPDGKEIRWRVARIRQDGRLLPFLIEDVTPRSLRVPGGPATEHPNGATGISRLELAASDERAATRSLAALVGAPDARAGSFRVGTCTLSLAAGRETGARRRLDAVGPGPLAAWLATGEGGEAGRLDRRLSEGAGLWLLEGTS